MYNNCSIKLQRKYDKYINFSQEKNPMYWTQDEINYLVENYMQRKRGCLQSIAEYLDRSYKSVSKQVWTLGLNN
jgi:hypothetical protein